MRFEKVIYKKKKKKILSLHSLPRFRPAGPFFRGPLTLLSLFPARPASRRPSHAPQLLGPAAAPAQQAAPGNRPRPRAQTLIARARLSAPSSPRAPRNRPARPHAATAPLHVVGACPPSRPAALNRHRAISAPPCCPALVSALAVHRGRPQPSPRDLRAPATPLRADSLLRAASVSISPLVSFSVLPSISPCISLLVLLAS